MGEDQSSYALASRDGVEGWIQRPKLRSEVTELGSSWLEMQRGRKPPHPKSLEGQSRGRNGAEAEDTRHTDTWGGPSLPSRTHRLWGLRLWGPSGAGSCGRLG